MTKIMLVSRCAWTLYNFRQGQMRALKQRGDEVIGGGSAGDGFEPKIEALGVPFVGLPVVRKAINPTADLRLFWTLWRWYRQEKPEIAHHFTIKPVIYGSLAARLARVPRIINTVTGLGYVFTEDSPKWLRRLVEWQYKFALAGSHYTFFQNSEDRDLFLLRKLVKPERSGLLPGSGVDTERFQPEADAAEDATRPVQFLMVARVLRDKGVYEFAEAARLVKRELPNVEFLLLGQRDERNPAVVPLADLDRWRDEGLLCWLGEVADVREIVAGADVVVLPSYYREGTPRSLLEAAALAKPLITTDNVGCREAVENGKTGLLIPIKDAPALAEAIKKLALDPAMRRSMGRAGREKMVREFDETIVLGKIVAVYDKEKL